MKKSLIASFLAMGMWAGCAGGEGGESESGMTLSFVVNKVQVPKAAQVSGNKQVVGFNLDDIDSGAGSSGGTCEQAKPDYFSGPPDNIAGVDNQLQTKLGVIELLLPDGKTMDQTLAEQITTGAFLLILDIFSVDDIQNDSNVRIDFYVGALAAGQQIQLDNNGLLAAGQTFVRGQKMVSVAGSIENGRLITIVPELTIDVNTANFQLPLIIRRAQLRTTVSSTGLSSGAIGGAVRVDDIINTVKKYAPLLEGTVKTWLNGLADIEPSASDTSVCESVSLGLAFGATTTTTP